MREPLERVEDRNPRRNRVEYKDAHKVLAVGVDRGSRRLVRLACRRCIKDIRVGGVGRGGGRVGSQPCAQSVWTPHVYAVPGQLPLDDASQVAVQLGLTRSGGRSLMPGKPEPRISSV